MNERCRPRNNDIQEQRMLYGIMQLQVAVIDLALFLDTHPNDPVALYKHKAYSTQLMKLKNEYEMLFGPLNLYSVETGDTWRYINGPWPWDRDWD
ncbi:MAG: spore coat protein CotJB [Tissierellia bacterium]|nr:spore coat protein CotJB [Tissierellia bacterium]MDD4782018.1 spore coat protein CotJB [Tissierellia bacterium]